MSCFILKFVAEGNAIIREDDTIEEVNRILEQKMKHKFFFCDTVLDCESRQVVIFSGYQREIMPKSHRLAESMSYVHWAKSKYDILLFVMPIDFHFGDGMGSHPVGIFHAMNQQATFLENIMSDKCVMISSAVCNRYCSKEMIQCLQVQPGILFCLKNWKNIKNSSLNL